jgi:hypothetical protein
MLHPEELPLTEIRPTPFFGKPEDAAFAALCQSVKQHGILIPIMVRPVTYEWLVRPGRRNAQNGWFILRSDGIVGRDYLGPTPILHPTERAARRAIPPQRPYEVLRGHGNRRLLAAKAAQHIAIPVVLVTTAANEGEELERFFALHGPGIC